MTDTVSTDLGVLTREDIAAFKLADSVSFHHLSAELGGPQIRLHLDMFKRVPNVFTRREQTVFPDVEKHERRRDIPVESKAYGYGLNGSGTSDDGFSEYNMPPNLACFEMIHSAQVSATWSTIVSLLRTGDRLTLSWVADNNTENVRSVGFHVDELKLFVHRGDNRLVFHVATRCGPDNSARMIRPNGI